MAVNIFNIESKIYTRDDFHKKKSLTTAKITEYENGAQNKTEIFTKVEKWFNFKTELKWVNIFFLSFLHIGFLYVIFNFNWFGDWRTTIWSKYIF